MTVIEKAVQWAINTANDNSHGYSQTNRWGVDYDCSSFVITAYEQAGVPVKQAGATYTGNMRNAFLACGFFDATNLVNLGSGGGIQAGDVLLNYASHTCIAIGAGRVANCRTDEGHPQAGDQSGNEIRLQGYWNYPWNCVLRYKDKNQTEGMPYGDSESGSYLDGLASIVGAKPVSTTPTTKPSTGTIETVKENHEWKPPLLKYDPNTYYEAVKLGQSLLNVHNFDSGKADGYYGAKTVAAVNRARRYYGIDEQDFNEKLWKKLGVS